MNTSERFSSIGLGRAATCALSREGRPYCWGRGVTGLLGRGDLVSDGVPAPVSAAAPAPVAALIALEIEAATVVRGDTIMGQSLVMDQNGRAMPAPLPTITSSNPAIAEIRNAVDVPATPAGAFRIVGLASGTVVLTASVPGLPSQTVTLVIN